MGGFSIRAISVTCALAALFFSGCGRQPIRLNIGPEVIRPEKCAVLFFADGMDRARMRALLAAGKLPNIERRFVRGGVSVEQAICGLPALTYPSTVSLFTGRLPGHHGIPGNQWFDRRTMKWIDYITAPHYLSVNQDFHDPTIYEMIPDHLTVNVFCPTNRGATVSYVNMVSTDLGWGGGFYEQVDQFVGGSLEFVGPLAQRTKRWPSLITFYFPGLDQIGHDHGSDSAAYESALINVDAQIGRVCDSLEQDGLLNRSYLVLATDHGHIPARDMKEFDLMSWLKDKRKLKAHIGDIPAQGYEHRYSYLDAKDAMVVDGSHRRMLIFLRGPQGWASPPDAEAVGRFLDGSGSEDRLADVPGVEFACMRESADRIRVSTRFGDFHVERTVDGGQKKYRTDLQSALSSDVIEKLGMVKEAEIVSEGWVPAGRWLEETSASAHPDFVPQIVEYFDSPRAGDVVVFLSSGWCAVGHHRGEHGSCMAEDMQIPLYFAGPDLPQHATLPRGRLVDVTPTILDLIGEADRIPGNLDGVSLAPQLKAAGRVQP